MALILLNPYLTEDRQNCLQGPVEVVPGGRREKGDKNLFEFREFLWDGVYLFLSQGLQLFRLALPVVFHDHHGGVDFAHRQVCGCWENDKLPCKIRPEWDGTLSRGGNGSGGQDTQQQQQVHNNMQSTSATGPFLFHGGTDLSIKIKTLKLLFDFEYHSQLSPIVGHEEHLHVRQDKG